MKIDENDIVYGMDSMEHIKSFLEHKDSQKYFQKLKTQVMWAQVDTPSIPQTTCGYGELERACYRCQVLEELIFLLEEVFETRIVGAKCFFFKNGDEYWDFSRFFRGNHTFFLSFGHPRKIAFRERESPEGKIITMNSGDLFYTSMKANSKYERSCLREPTIIQPRIEIVFFSDTPYINRRQHLRFMNVLGFGKVPIWYQSEENQIPEDLTAVMLPTQFSQILGQRFGHPIEDEHFPVEIIYEVSI